ncbi:cytochrome C oxidase subunit II [Paracidobacterium acidisoli]|uniref:cytochrome C oxidase subunit II n=1 Tax=Paracidobacterium acidisoli TaxID=2303751 RepID=UPI003314DA74
MSLPHSAILAAVPWMPGNGALHGAIFDRLMGWNLAILLALFLLAHLLLIAALLRRGAASASSAAKIPSLLTKWLPLAGLCVLYVWMAVTAERLWAADRFAGPAPASMQVEVTGVQFQWYFRYPGQDAAFGATRPRLIDAAGGNPLGIDPADPRGHDDVISSVLELPAGREVDLRLRSQDVIHGLFIPGMRLKQNAVPGMVLHVHFTLQQPGSYAILCSQVCGMGHARMQATLRVVPPAEFDRWLSTREHAVSR